MQLFTVVTEIMKLASLGWERSFISCLQQGRKMKLKKGIGYIWWFQNLGNIHTNIAELHPFPLPPPGIFATLSNRFGESGEVTLLKHYYQWTVQGRSALEVTPGQALAFS